MACLKLLQYLKGLLKPVERLMSSINPQKFAQFSRNGDQYFSVHH